MPFAYLNPAVYQSSDASHTVASRLKELKVALSEIQAVTNKYKLDLTLPELSRYCISASILQMVNRQQMDLLVPDTKLYRSFDHWAKKYQLTALRLERQQSANRLWLKKPDAAAILQYEQRMSDSQGLFKRWQRKSIHNTFFKDYTDQVSMEGAEELLDRLKAEYETAYELEQVRVKIKA